MVVISKIFNINGWKNTHLKQEPTCLKDRRFVHLKSPEIATYRCMDRLSDSGPHILANDQALGILINLASKFFTPKNMAKFQLRLNSMSHH